jgi:hypothetical protein
VCSVSLFRDDDDGNDYDNDDVRASVDAACTSMIWLAGSLITLVWFCRFLARKHDDDDDEDEEDEEDEEEDEGEDEEAASSSSADAEGAAPAGPVTEETCGWVSVFRDHPREREYNI